MAYVLAENPVKHPNYPNGDYYAVLDTEDGVVEYYTIDEIKNFISLGYSFIGNHYLAIKDTKEFTKKGNLIIRYNEKLNANLVYYQRFNVIEFIDTGCLTTSLMHSFKKGLVRDYLKSYSLKHERIVGLHCAESKFPKEKLLWDSMYSRLSDKSYSDTTIGDFRYFPNFVTFFNNQANLKILEDLDLNYALDKDILGRGKKCYDSKFCCLVPSTLNEAFTKTTRGIYPVGHFKSSDNSIAVSVESNILNYKEEHSITIDNIRLQKNYNYYISVARRYKYISKIPQEQHAAVGYIFLWYKKRKEYILKELAKYWYYYEHTDGQIYHCIIKECYDALMNWEVDIND